MRDLISKEEKEIEGGRPFLKSTNQLDFCLLLPSFLPLIPSFFLSGEYAIEVGHDLN